MSHIKIDVKIYLIVCCKRNYEIFFVIYLTFFSIHSYAKKCADFNSQKQAQAWYEKQKNSGQSGWKSLDRDNDGQACDCLPGGNGKKFPKRKK